MTEPVTAEASATAAPGNERPSLVSQIAARAKQDPWGAIAALGLVLSVVCLVLELRYLTSDEVANERGVLLRNAFYGAWTVGWMMLVTFSVRTLRIRNVIRLWMLGFFPVLAAVLITTSATEFIAEDGNLRTAFIVPILEEGLKLAPLLVMVALAWKQRTLEPAITDFTIAGFAIGAGFGLHEDGLWVRDIAGGFDGSWCGRLFPNFLNDDPFVVAHPGWTALVGLGVGLFWHFRRARLAWILGAVPLAVAVLDHISINYRGDAADRLRGLVMDGKLPAWMLILGFVLAVFIDLDAKKKGAAGLPSRTVKDCIERPKVVPGKARPLVAMLLVAQLRSFNGTALRRHRQRAVSATPAASAAVTTF